MHQLLISHHARPSLMPSAKTLQLPSDMIGSAASTSCSSSMRSNLKKTALVLVNAAFLAILPPCSEAQAFSLPKPIQAIEASLSKNITAKDAATKALATLEKPDVPSPCKKNCQLSEAGYALIRLFEGYSPYPYRDAVGLWTIGYGHLILPGEKFTMLTPLQGQQLLVRDAESKVRGVNALVNVSLNRNQFASLTSFTFNLGLGVLKSSTLLKRVNAERHSEVPPQINRFVYAGGKVLKGLVTRRLAEAKLYQEPTTNP